MGSFLEKLKSIVGIDLSNVTKLIHVNFSFHIDNSVKIEGSTVNVNPGKLNGKQKRGLQDLIRNVGLEESGAILDAEYTEEVEEARAALPAISEISKKFVPLLPPGDIPLLNACLFLRRKFDSGQAVGSLKDEIGRIYGPRGRNFANLCSAGYLEDWFWPLYEHLLSSYPGEPSVAKAKFTVLYNNIITELPWTEFASMKWSAPTLQAHIVEKMRRNAQNGVRFLNVHGLGDRNVKKVSEILQAIQQETGCTIGRIDRDKYRIFVRLEAPSRLS